MGNKSKGCFGRRHDGFVTALSEAVGTEERQVLDKGALTLKQQSLQHPPHTHTHTTVKINNRKGFLSPTWGLLVKGNLNQQNS